MDLTPETQAKISKAFADKAAAASAVGTDNTNASLVTAAMSAKTASQAAALAAQQAASASAHDALAAVAAELNFPLPS